MAPIVIFGHAIASIQQNGASVAPHVASLLSSTTSLTAPSKSSQELETRTELKPTERKEALIDLLRSRRIPMSELGNSDLLVLGCLRVTTPYTASACTCENEIVLGRFHALLEELDAKDGAQTK